MHGEEYKLWRSSLYSFLQLFTIFSFFGPHILLNILLSTTFSVCSSLKVKDHVLRPYKTKGKIIVLHILIVYVCVCVCVCLGSKREDKILWTEWYKILF
jgi:hypothetical protein